MTKTQQYLKKKYKILCGFSIMQNAGSLMRKGRINPLYLGKGEFIKLLAF
jgi:hypothetical protein